MRVSIRIEKQFQTISNSNSISVARDVKKKFYQLLHPKERSSLDAWIGRVTSEGNNLEREFQLFVHSLSRRIHLDTYSSISFFSFLLVCSTEEMEGKPFSSLLLRSRDDRCSIPYPLESKISTEACPGKGISGWKRWRGFSNLRATDFVARLRVEDS